VEQITGTSKASAKRAAGQAWVENEESLTRAAIIDRPLPITSGQDFRTIQACPKDPPLRQW
jgi:hypothetical protein